MSSNIGSGLAASQKRKEPSTAVKVAWKKVEKYFQCGVEVVKIGIDY